VFESIVDALSGSSWSYAIVFAVAALDAFFPVVPSETVAIAAGVLAGAGDLQVVPAILAAAGGAFLGDNISFGIGHFLGERTVNRFFSSAKAQRRLDWAERQLEERGAYIITVARFIPGGRTATTFTAGYVDFRWRRFLVFDALDLGLVRRAAGLFRRLTVPGGAVEGAAARVRPRARGHGCDRDGPVCPAPPSACLKFAALS
jgi:membrane-associated protein